MHANGIVDFRPFSGKMTHFSIKGRPKTNCQIWFDLVGCSNLLIGWSTMYYEILRENLFSGPSKAVGTIFPDCM
jgi:hypothetical protein